MLDTHHGVTTGAPQSAPQPAYLASHSQPDELATLLDHARQQPRERGLPYAGGVSPTEAWELFCTGHAVLVDVRTNETAGSSTQGSALDASAWLQWLTRRYRATLEMTLRRPSLTMLAALVSLAVSGLQFWTLSSELAPLEDTGWFAIHVNAPEGATLDYTDRYAKDSEQQAANIPEMDSYYTVVARGFRPTLVNRAVTWVTLKDWSDRDRAQREIVNDVEPALSAIPGATVFALNPPPFNQEDSKTPVQIVVRGPTYDVLDEIVAKVRHDATGHP